jgi:hypothetical protein
MAQVSFLILNKISILKECNMKKDYIKRTGQIYALAIQKGITEEELFNYTEKAFAYLYLKENKVVKYDDTRRESENRIQ